MPTTTYVLGRYAASSRNRSRPTRASSGLRLSLASLYLLPHFLLLGSVGRTDLWGGDKKAVINSIKQKIYPLHDDIVFIAGHGPSSTIGYEKQHYLLFFDPSLLSSYSLLIYYHEIHTLKIIIVVLHNF